MRKPPLQWRNTTNSRSHKMADGYYPGWVYELTRVGTRIWIAVFYDGNIDKNQTLAIGNFVQARQAVLKHHNHPGV